ncbi:MAG: hypothetical protein ACK4UY_00815 [Dietzia sp.]
MVLVLAGCTVHETSHTVNGTPVVENPAPDGDVDPCDLPQSLLQDLGVDDMPLTRGVGSAPTCSWEISSFQGPRMYYWVSGPTEPDPINELTPLAGQQAEIFHESPGLARYIVRLDDHTFDTAYSADISADTPPAPDGAELVISALLSKYDYN